MPCNFISLVNDCKQYQLQCKRDFPKLDWCLRTLKCYSKKIIDMPQSPSSNDRLDSWKEIAAYLNRTERTVIRWEKRGLPVRRVPGGKKQAVFAYKHELDGWLELGAVSEGSLTQPSGEHQAAGKSDLDLAVSDSAGGSSNQPANLPGTKSSP
ncbi:MAG TPA: helix-turn-helix domain-containing protein, partial [Candidatus Angelobacter sp.]|nr:helix-turn-helix domain-containing protein [Candidatus Angelobacter sp.]